RGVCRFRFVSDLLNPNGSWKVNLLETYFYPCDVEEILKIRASPRQQDDTIAWGPGRLGSFSVRSAYNFAFDDSVRSSESASSSSPNGTRKCWDFIWKTNVPPAVKFFAWRVATNSLPTWPNKRKRCLEESDLCPVCQREPEHTFHALCRCQNSVNLWNCMSTIWPLPNLGDVQHNGPEWLLHALQPLSENVRCMLLFTLWRCWHVRNEVVHLKPVPPLEVSKNFLSS
uniref:Reverse transcriptase zinc-binding domain-containing protein n=1 Tax=Triticum urartu TaxID=4572 RepID=A0A8R7Q328_TRIUA